LVDEEYFDLEARLKKIQAAAAALEEQKLEKLLYTYKQVRAVYIILFCFARFQNISCCSSNPAPHYLPYGVQLG
jgi:hypothetical protein